MPRYATSHMHYSITSVPSNLSLLFLGNIILYTTRIREQFYWHQPQTCFETSLPLFMFISFSSETEKSHFQIDFLCSDTNIFSDVRKFKLRTNVFFTKTLKNAIVESEDFWKHRYSFFLISQTSFHRDQKNKPDILSSNQRNLLRSTKNLHLWDVPDCILRLRNERLVLLRCPSVAPPTPGLSQQDGAGALSWPRE